jgi:hypothetical protein
VAVVVISFNDYSVIRDWEHADSVAAVCRRIAFAALNIAVPNTLDYDAFAETHVSESDILRWLGKSPCLLLIDELNLLNLDRKQGSRLEDFLTTQFLIDSGRHFVFSSHWLPWSGALSKFSVNVSKRGIDIFQLPLISSAADAREARLGCFDRSAGVVSGSYSSFDIIHKRTG